MFTRTATKAPALYVAGNTVALLSGRTVVFDTFNRADNASSLGTADTGQVWSALNGTWGIQTNLAYEAVAGTGDGVAVVDSKVSDCTVSAIVSSAIDANQRLCARVIDKQNMILLTYNGSNFTVYRVTAGAGTQLITLTVTVSIGDRIGLRVVGSNIAVYQNGNVMGSATETQGQTNTQHGMEAAATGAGRWNDFRVTVP